MDRHGVTFSAEAWSRLDGFSTSSVLMTFFPNVSLEATPGVPVFAEFPNELPRTHLLPVDATVCDEAPNGRAVVHLHGGSQDWTSDGNPYAWFEPGYAAVGQDWRQPVYTWANTRRAAMLWYHDHAGACGSERDVG